MLEDLLSEKNMGNFSVGCRSGIPLRKTAVSFPGEKTAACLSTLLLLTSSKVRARSVSEAFFLSDTPSLLVTRKKYQHVYLLAYGIDSLLKYMKNLGVVFERD